LDTGRSTRSGATSCGNPTLEAVVTLCRRTAARRGLRRVVTYNYDNLLELMLPRRATQTICRPTELNARALPIYHVHGYIPVDDTHTASPFDDIVLTEDQYNRVANDPYSWTNLVQLQAMTDSVGLVVGMSLTDRNLRRLLDATSRAAQRPELYAFTERPRAPEPSDADLRTIARRAHEHYLQVQAHPDGVPPHSDPEPAAIKGRTFRVTYMVALATTTDERKSRNSQRQVCQGKKDEF
jgi:SIR2-like domain